MILFISFIHLLSLTSPPPFFFPQGDFFIFDLGTRFGALSFLFSLHRTSESICDSPFFDTTQWWLDSESWFETVLNGDVSSVKEFLEANPSYTDLLDRFSGQTAAHFAADKMDVGMLEVLVKYQANFLATDRTGFFPFLLFFPFLFSVFPPSS